MSKFKFKLGNFEVELEGEEDFIKASMSETYEFVKASANQINITNNSQNNLIENTIISNKEMRLIETQDTIAEDNFETLSIFMDSKNFKTDWQKVTGICYYYQNTESKTTYSQKEIREYLENSTMPNLSNFSMAFNKAVSENMLKLVDKFEKLYTLTNVGINFVKDFFNDSPKVKKVSQSKTQKKQISDEDKLVIDEIKKLSSNFEQEDLDFLESLKTQREQIYFASYMYSKKFKGQPLKAMYVSSLINATGIDNISEVAVVKVFSANKKYYESVKRGIYTFTPKAIREMENLKLQKDNID